MITVHHLNNSRSQRVLWLLEELGVPYEVVRYERDPRTMLAPPALQAVHPLGKSPVVTDNGLTLAESGAIVDYLANRYGSGRLVPRPDSPERLRYTYWLHYAEGSAMPPLLLKLVFDTPSLSHAGRKRHRRNCKHGYPQLQSYQRLIFRFSYERPKAMQRPPHGDCRQDENARRRFEWSEPKGHPNHDGTANECNRVIPGRNLKPPAKDNTAEQHEQEKKDTDFGSFFLVPALM